jgi:putative transposase
MCRVLKVSRSGYYSFKSRVLSKTRISNEKLLIEINRVYLEHKRNYGVFAIHKRKFKMTTNSKHNYSVWPNVLKRNFVVDEPNIAWVSDITYIWTLEGWLYLAAVLDLFSRRIVGLAMDKTIAESLVLKAVRQAILRRNPKKGLIYHSDRGSQYASNNFKAVLAQNEFVGSMSRKGDCWDNAVAESFFHTLKVELVHQTIFKTRDEAKRRIFEYVEMYYNGKRAHSTLGYLSPLEYEQKEDTT